MFYLVTGIMIFCSLLLVGVTFLQNSKNEGSVSSGSFSSNNQIVGVKKSADTLENITWILIIIILSLSVLSSILSKKNKESFYSTLNIEEAKKKLE